MNPEPSTLDRLETVYLDGCADDVIGDVDALGHYYRVGRYIVQTDSQGFHEVFTFDTLEAARHKWQEIEAAYTLYDTDDDEVTA